MSMLYALKPYKDRLLRPAALGLRAAGLTPNMVTAAGVLLSLAGGLLASSGHLPAGILLFLAGACLDALDGSLARACGLSSEFGRYFDSIADRVSELLFVAGAIAGGAPVAALVVVAGSIVLLAARVNNHRKGLHSNAAMFGRPERIALLIAGLLVPEPYCTASFAIAGLLCIVSSIQALVSGSGSVERPRPSIPE
jgi:phosphatidylglycerophosphate synthase